MENRFGDMTPEKLQQLLEQAARKMGTTPEELKKQVESGKFDHLLNSPQAKAMMQRMQGKK